MLDSYKEDSVNIDFGFGSDRMCPLPLMELNFTPKLSFEESTLKDDFLRLNQIMKELDEGVANGNQQQVIGSLEFMYSMLKIAKKQIQYEKISTEFIAGFCKETNFLPIVEMFLTTPDPAVMPSLLKALVSLSSYPKVFEFIGQINISSMLANILETDIPPDAIYNAVILMISYLSMCSSFDSNFTSIIENLPAILNTIYEGLGVEWCFFLCLEIVKNSSTDAFQPIIEAVAEFMPQARPIGNNPATSYTRITEIAYHVLRKSPESLDLLMQQQIPAFLVENYGRGAMNNIDRLKLMKLLSLLYNTGKENISDFIGYCMESIPAQDAYLLYQNAVPSTEKESEKENMITCGKERITVIKVLTAFASACPEAFIPWSQNFIDIFDRIISVSMQIGDVDEKIFACELLGVLIKQYWEQSIEWFMGNLDVIGLLDDLLDTDNIEAKVAIIDMILLIGKKIQYDNGAFADVSSAIEENGIIDSLNDIETDNEEVKGKIQAINDIFG